MKISIHRHYNQVYLDGQVFEVDCSALDETIHAVQFNTETNKGHIEFVNEDDVPANQYKGNEKIGNVSQFQSVIDAAIQLRDSV